MGLQAQGISTGPELDRSTTRSQYFRGITKDMFPLISRLKISGISKQPDGSLSVRLLTLDSDGNFVPLQSVASRITTKVICRSQSPISFSSDLEASSASPKNASSSAFIAIDNSIMSGTLTRDVILSIKSALLGGSPLSDSIGVGSFNQSLTTLQQVGPAQRVLENLSADDLRPASGVSALYASAISAASELEQARGVKSLIIVTTSGDNASAIWNSRDVARYLKDAGIGVYVIRVGYDMASFPLRYIASYTGGCVYTVEDDESSTIGDVIREILYAQRWNSVLTAQAGVEDVADCDSPWLRVELEGDSIQPAVADSIILTPREVLISTSPAVVALFDDQTDVGLQQYYPLLLSIAERLSEDINMKIELSGHVGSDVAEAADQRALERAENVKNFLLINGALDKQVITRSEGSRKPRYYFQDDGSRRLMNNRVEAVLITSEQRPSTIIVDQVSNEDEATKQRSVWVARDYQVYYEPVIDKGDVAYRIVLWGYQSKALADAAAAKIKKQYKPRYTIVE
jgi:outer membrane protein OmpA-like peptidoglycan-associated protein